MGVNIQYVKDAKLTLRTLAVRELFESHTSEHLLKGILHILELYEIKVRDLYSFTSDNGSNMLKLYRLLKDVQDEEIAADKEDGTQNTDTFDRQDSQGLVFDETFDISMEYLDMSMEDMNVDRQSPRDKSHELSLTYDNIHDNNFHEDVEKTENLTAMIDGSFLEDGNLRITGIRCAAHSLQLSVDNAISECKLKNFLEKARKAAVEFRKPSVLYEIKQFAPLMKKVVLDVSTRWHSTLDMLISLEAYKPFSRFLKKSTLSETDWTTIDTCIKSLLPAKIATKQLQEEQLLMSDFYCIWQNCKLDTAKVESDLAQALVSCMDVRENVLLDNDSLLAAVLLDPRCNSALEPRNQQHAMDHLQKIANRFQAQSRESEQIVQNSVTNCSSDIEDRPEVLLPTPVNTFFAILQKKNVKILGI